VTTVAASAGTPGSGPLISRMARGRFEALHRLTSGCQPTRGARAARRPQSLGSIGRPAGAVPVPLCHPKAAGAGTWKVSAAAATGAAFGGPRRSPGIAVLAPGRAELRQARKAGCSRRRAATVIAYVVFRFFGGVFFVPFATVHNLSLLVEMAAIQLRPVPKRPSVSATSPPKLCGQRWRQVSSNPGQEQIRTRPYNR